MIYIECKKCINCDIENDCCKLYGSDPNEAVVKCASDAFRGYIPNENGGGKLNEI